MNSQELIQKTVAIFVILKTRITKLKVASYNIEAPIQKEEGAQIGKIDLYLDRTGQIITILVYSDKILIKMPSEAIQYADDVLNGIGGANIHIEYI